jgi:hypothetical protein
LGRSCADNRWIHYWDNVIGVDIMSYIRYAWAYKHVKGESDDYIFPTKDIKGKPCLETYGHLSNNSLVELLCEAIEEKWPTELDKPFREFIKNSLAKKLGVELRKRPLEWEEISRDMSKRSAKTMKDMGYVVRNGIYVQKKGKE